MYDLMCGFIFVTGNDTGVTTGEKMVYLYLYCCVNYCIMHYRYSRLHYT